jgi:glycosyltransferase involved in cell wall biosynthesis
MLRQPKRPDLLIEIARRAQNLRFVVCGGPNDYRSPQGYGTRVLADLKALPNIDYRGEVSPASACDIIAKASALLCTSEREGFPNVFLEAWASGTPVVSLKVDPDHVIVRKRIGILSSDITKVIDSLTTLIDDPVRRGEIGVRSRQHVAGAHSEATVVRTLTGALRNGDESLLPPM